MSITPGTVWRSRAMSPLTLWPGSWPPSPGFEPCAILISISFALARYEALTPKRPDATCLIALFARSPFSRCLKRSGSSPPSPEFDFPPIRFIAIARHSCASGDSAPERHPGRGEPAADILDGLHLVHGHRARRERDEFRKVAQRERPVRQQLGDVSRVFLLFSGLYEGVEAFQHRRRDRMHLSIAPEPVDIPGRPSCGAPSLSDGTGCAYPCACRNSDSRAISANPIPPTCEDVPVKQRSMTAGPDADRLENLRPLVAGQSTEMPIFDMIFSSPSSIAFR